MLQNQIALEQARREVEAHCMCARLVDTPPHFIAYYPIGFAIGGVRAPRSAAGLQLMLKRMEADWTRDLPWHVSDLP